MRGHADGAHPRPPAAVGDAEGLVQVEMRHVRAELPGQAETQQRVEIGAVHVDLAAVAVDHLADLDNGFLEHAVGRGIGDHQRRQVVGEWASALARRSARSTLPSSSQATTCTVIPAITALAGLVPWAELGIRQTCRPPSPRLS